MADNLGDLKFFPPAEEHGIEDFLSLCMPPDNCLPSPVTCSDPNILEAALKVQHDSEDQCDELTAIVKQHSQNQSRTTAIQHTLLAPNIDHPSRLESSEEQPHRQQSEQLQDTSCAKPECGQDEKLTHFLPSHRDVTPLGSAGDVAPVLAQTDPDGGREVSSEIELLKKENERLSAENFALKERLGLLTQEMACLTKKVQAPKDSVEQLAHLATKGTPGSESHPKSESRINYLEKQLEYLQKEVASDKYRISLLELQVQATLASTSNGTYIWRIPDITQKRSEDLKQQIKPIYSLPFYTGPNGYKMCLHAYLNGDGEGYATHLSVFFILMRGEYDALLQWPFDHKVSLILIDQIGHRHIVKTMIPDSKNASFQQPQSDMNIASGFSQFADAAILENICYSKDDTMFLKCIVDVSRIYHP